MAREGAWRKGGDVSPRLSSEPRQRAAAAVVANRGVVEGRSGRIRLTVLDPYMLKYVLLILVVYQSSTGGCPPDNCDIRYLPCLYLHFIRDRPKIRRTLIYYLCVGETNLIYVWEKRKFILPPI